MKRSETVLHSSPQSLKEEKKNQRKVSEITKELQADHFQTPQTELLKQFILKDIIGNN